MKPHRKMIFTICLTALLLVLFSGAVQAGYAQTETTDTHPELIENHIFDELRDSEKKKGGFIKWLDLNVTTKVLLRAYELSKKYHSTDTPLPFCEALSYLSVKNGNRFSDGRDLKRLDELVKKVTAGENIGDMMQNNKAYSYYLSCYRAVFRGITGETVNEGGETKWGLTGYFPFAAGYWYTHYDDFGNGRSYGFKRRHLGHDMMGSVGTPVIAVEGGTVTELGWNQYGGWRVGVRSDDGQRYYYYAHLRRDHPYVEGLVKGAQVTAGQHIGYLGQTGYSTKENVNLKSGKPHLHIGLQIIFDESQEDGNGEIWIDMYALTNLLAKNKVKVS